MHTLSALPEIKVPARLLVNLTGSSTKLLPKAVRVRVRVRFSGPRVWD